MKKIRITGYGTELLKELRQIRKEYNEAKNDDEMTEAYLREIHPLETQIIEEIFDAEDNNSGTVKILQSFLERAKKPT
jgi:hypothetical protein